MEETDKAYIAGFIDGEGYIGITRQERENRPTMSYRTILTISNTKIEALKFCEKFYGGRIRIEANTFRWYCPSANQERLLLDILPYLKLKQKNAILVIDYKSYLGEATKENLQIRENFWKAIKEFNRNKFKEDSKCL